MYELKSVDVTVIGGGIFGCLAALGAAEKGLGVLLLEQKDALMQGATLNNQNRLHLGYHYPRDLETALQCQKGFDSFQRRFEPAILSGFRNIYAISSTDSKVTFPDFKRFCEAANLPAPEINPIKHSPKIHNCDGAIETQEVVYDSVILAKLVEQDLKKSRVTVKLKSPVVNISRESMGFTVSTPGETIRSSAIINCTYSNFNFLNSFVTSKKTSLQYELTVVPVVKWRDNLPPVGITVMDGPFFTVLPFGKTDNYLAYHVEHSVLERHVGIAAPEDWFSSTATRERAEAAFRSIVQSAQHWLPELGTAKFHNYLTTIRSVLANVDDTDKRPSLISRLDGQAPFFSVFSGKIDHSIWVAQELADRLSNELNASSQAHLDS